MCDTSSTGTAIPTAFIENDRTRVTEWRLDKGEIIPGWHRHEYDYVVVPLFDGFLDIDDKHKGRSRAEMKKGIPYFRELGVEHDVINANEFECAFVEIEFLE